MDARIEQLLQDYRMRLSPGGWTVNTRPQPGQPDHIVFNHPLVGDNICTLPLDWPDERLRSAIDRSLQRDLQLVRDAPPMDDPAKMGGIRAQFEGRDWDEKTRVEVAGMLISIGVTTRAEAEWLVRAGTPIGSKRTE